MKKRLRVLIVEDSADDYELIKIALAKAGLAATCERVDTEASMSAALGRNRYDIVLSDHVMPNFSSQEALKLLRQRDEDLPFILVSGKIGETAAVELMKAGASGYVNKNHLALLPAAVERALDEWEAIVKRKEAEEKFWSQTALLEAIVESANGPVFSVDKEYRYTSFNKSHVEVMKTLYGADIELGQSMLGNMTVEEDRRNAKTSLDRALKGEQANEETFFGEKNLARICYEISYRPITRADGKVYGAAVYCRDLTERKRMELQLIRERDIAQRYLDIASVLIVVLSGNGTVEMINEYGADLLGYPVEKLVGKNWFDNFVLSAERGAVKQVFNKIMKGEMAGVDSYENEVVAKDGSLHLVSWRNIYITGEDGAIIQTLSSGMDISHRKHAEEEKAKSYEKLKLTLEGTVNALSSVAEHRDPYTSGHQERVTKLACAIAEEMELSPEICEDIRIAGRLHDIGKIEVPAEILSKPGRLTDVEFSMIKVHSTVGYDILKEAEFPCEVAKMVLSHHERMDGSGYPKGLKADDIFIGAKIMAVADVIEAMSSHRPYRASLGIDKALEEIEKNRDKLYDPDVVDICLKLFREKAFTF